MSTLWLTVRYRLSFSAEQEITQALEAAQKTWDNATSDEITDGYEAVVSEESLN